MFIQPEIPVSEIRNLIFDMGNVLIDIDIPLTFQALSARTGRSLTEVEKAFAADGLHARYESGLLAEEAYRRLIGERLSSQLSPEAFRADVLKLLLEMPAARLQRLRELSGHYRLFLLSNTNAVHVQHVIERAAEMGFDFIGLFEKAYLSHEMGHVKPQPEIYQQVIRQSNLIPQQSVFIDDVPENLEAAARQGIWPLWLEPGRTTMLDLTEPFLR